MCSHTTVVRRMGVGVPIQKIQKDWPLPTSHGLYDIVVERGHCRGRQWLRWWVNQWNVRLFLLVLSSGRNNIPIQRTTPLLCPNIGTTTTQDHANLWRITLQYMSVILLSNTSKISLLMTYLAFHWTIMVFSPHIPTLSTHLVVEGPPSAKSGIYAPLDINIVAI